MANAMQVAVVLAVIGFAVAMAIWRYMRSDQILSHWAQDNGYEIVSSERRWLRRGPYFFWTSEGQDVYYVTVRTPDGQLRRGWVRCGSWFCGVLSNAAEVQWDE
jgi:hypothetical protein